MITLKILRILFTVGSAICFFLATLGHFPESPHKGEIISAKPFEELFAVLKRSSRYNSYGCACLFISLIFEIVILFLD